MSRILAITPEGYAILLPTLFSSFTAMIVAIITAIRTKDVQKQVTPPSNGQTLGHAMETIQKSVAPASVPPNGAHSVYQAMTVAGWSDEMIDGAMSAAGIPEGRNQPNAT